jgi:hypothetical protein
MGAPRHELSEALELVLRLAVLALARQRVHHHEACRLDVLVVLALHAVRDVQRLAPLAHHHVDLHLLEQRGEAPLELRPCVDEAVQRLLEVLLLLPGRAGPLALPVARLAQQRREHGALVRRLLRRLERADGLVRLGLAATQQVDPAAQRHRNRVLRLAIQDHVHQLPRRVKLTYVAVELRRLQEVRRLGRAAREPQPQHQHQQHQQRQGARASGQRASNAHPRREAGLEDWVRYGAGR